MSKAVFNDVSFATEAYEDRVVIYIDILGFKQWINNPKTSEEQVLSLFKELSCWKGNGGIQQREGDQLPKMDLSFSFFSDSLIITYPRAASRQYFSRIHDIPEHAPIAKEDYVDIITAIEAAFRVQSLIFDKFFLLSRGAISLGKVFHKDSENLLFGPAINDAVWHEQNICNTPRVILTNSIREFYSKDKLEDSGMYQDKWLVEDSDGIVYLNFLFPLLSRKISEEINLIKSNIEANIKNYANNPKYLSKWSWLANLFNLTVTRFKELERYQSYDEIDLIKI
ncbi:MAG: hypothetical protein KGP29_07455 [Proteobacteria bacterium]|nr:hypothetical protein [Pseudomonadota bacterium]